MFPQFFPASNRPRPERRAPSRQGGKNIQRSTFNREPSMLWQSVPLDVGCSMLVVGCFPNFPRSAFGCARNAELPFGKLEREFIIRPIRRSAFQKIRHPHGERRRNIQHPTTNIQQPILRQSVPLDVGCSMLVVGCFPNFQASPQTPAPRPEPHPSSGLRTPSPGFCITCV